MKQILALSESKVTEHTSVIFTAYTAFSEAEAERIWQYALAHLDADTLIVQSDVLSHAETIRHALMECLGFAVMRHPALEHTPVYRTMRQAWMTLKRDFLHTMQPMEYCKLILHYTMHQLQDYLEGKRKDFFPFRFFMHRTCSILQSDGTEIWWDMDTEFGQVVLPDMKKVVYVSFDCVPELVLYEESNEPWYFHDDYPFGLTGSHYTKYWYDSMAGLYPMQERNTHFLHEKNYEVLDRTLFRTVCLDSQYPQMCWQDALDGAKKGAAYLCDHGMEAKPQFFRYDKMKAPELQKLDRVPFYTLAFRKKIRKWVQLRKLDTVSAMALTLALYYIGAICDSCHAKNLTVVRRMFEEEFAGDAALADFAYIWKLPHTAEQELILDSHPVHQLGAAMWTLMWMQNHVNTHEEDLVSAAVGKAVELSNNSGKMTDLLPLVGAFAGMYR